MKVILLCTTGVWAKTNNMILNPKRCKEMIISFRRNIEHPPSFLTGEGINELDPTNYWVSEQYEVRFAH